MEKAAQVECNSNCVAAGREHADTKPAATRKRRNRSGGSESEDSPEVPAIEHVSKKMSISDMVMPPSERDVDRVALLDAGAQYGKVRASQLYYEGVQSHHSSVTTGD